MFFHFISWWTCLEFFLFWLINATTMGIHKQVFVWTRASFSLGYVFRIWTAGSSGNSMFNFLGNARLFSRPAASSSIPIGSVWRIQFRHIVTSTSCYLYAQWRCSKWYLIVIWFVFPTWLMMLEASVVEHLFVCSCGYLCIIFGKRPT